MQWDSSAPHAGFSDAEKVYTPVISSEEFGPDKVNVQDAQNDPSSLYNILRHMTTARRNHPAFGQGKLYWITTTDKAVGSWIRYHGEDVVLVVSNTSHHPKENVLIKIPQKLVPSCSFAIDLLIGAKFVLHGANIQLNLDPYQFLWLNLSVDTCACFQALPHESD